MTTGHAQDAEQPETGITPGDKGAFRDVLSKDHARRGKPPVHLVDMTPDERIARAKDLGLPKFRVKQLANHYFGRLETESEAFTDLPAATRGRYRRGVLPASDRRGDPSGGRSGHHHQDAVAPFRWLSHRIRTHALPEPHHVMHLQPGRLRHGLSVLRDR